jgi:hypothetical protein
VAFLSPSFIIGVTAGILELFATTVISCAGANAKNQRPGKKVKSGA